MKAFLLAAGEGTRLKPLTNTIPKCLVPVKKEPLLAIWLDLCRLSGIDEVLINLHAHADEVRRFLAGRDFGIHIDLCEELVLLGSAGTIAANRAWVESDELFWILYADVLTNMNLSTMLAFHRAKRPAATMAVHRVSNPSQCGIVLVDNAHIVRGFVEKPEQPPGNLAFTGVMIATRGLLDVIPSTLPADLGFNVFPQLIGAMTAYEVHEYLVDIGTMAKYERAQSEWPGSRTGDVRCPDSAVHDAPTYVAPR
jgi:mannose-1-phosphate guanylyltransferase